MLLFEQPAETRLIFGRAIQGGHERLPLLLLKDKAGSVGECVLCLFASAANDELGDVDAMAVRGHLDQLLFRCSGAELEPAIARLFGR